MSNIHEALTMIRQSKFIEACRILEDLMRQSKIIEARQILEAMPVRDSYTNLLLGRVLALQGANAEALALLEPLVISENLPPTLRTIANTLLAFTLRRVDPIRAHEILDAVNPLKAGTSSVAGAAAAEWFLTIGILEMDAGRALKAERYLHRSLQLFRECHDELGESWTCNSLGNLLLQIGQIDDAKAFIELSMQIKNRHGDIRGQAVSHGVLGRCYYVQGNMKAAAEEYHEDLRLSRQVGDIGGESQMLSSLGEIALECNDYAEADRLFREAARSNPAPNNQAYAYAGMAMAAIERGDLETAQMRADESRAFIPNAMPWVSANLAAIDAMILARYGDIEGGIAIIRKTLEKLQSPTDVISRIKILYRLRDLLEQAGRIDEAMHAMSEALDKLCLLGAEADVGDLRGWMRRKDQPGLMKLALSRHFPPFLVDNIIQGESMSPAQLRQQTRRQDITVLFTDIRNFTSISRTLEPDDLLAMLNSWFRDATRIVQSHGGVVDKFIGDAMMVLFGVPDSKSDAAVHACRAALEIQEAVRTRNLRRQALGNGQQFQVGVGISRGDAVIGFLGSHLRLSFTAIGDSVNMASRLESATKEVPGAHILVNSAVANDPMVRDAIEMQPMPPVDLKGIGVTHIWNVVGVVGDSD